MVGIPIEDGYDYGRAGKVRILRRKSFLPEHW
jgi:hypothetical protein